MNYTNVSVKQFINHIITFNNIDEILNSCSNESEKGFIFERLFDIVIKFGFCDIFPNHTYSHLIGNSNNGKLKKLETYDNYLDEKTISGNSSGCSDITLQHKYDQKYIFITSKYPSNDDKTVEYYDIQNIVAMATKNKHIYTNYDIYLTVPNRDHLLEKVKMASDTSKYITDHIIEDHILDKYDLNCYFMEFKKKILKNSTNWTDLFLNKRFCLNLRFHQELITQKTSDLIEESNRSFLWGCKCRSGKTFMIGGIILKQLKIKRKLNVLIIVPAPTETVPQFTNDLLYKFKDFDQFTIHNIENSKLINNLNVSNNSNIFIMSKQLLQRYIDENVIIAIKNLKLDIIAFDENHFSGTTDLSKSILKSYSSKNTVKIYLTATYNKPLKEWSIDPECLMFWDIED
jgi:hypothetical protein